MRSHVVVTAALLAAAAPASARTFSDGAQTPVEAKVAGPVAAALSQIADELQRVVPHALLDRVVGYERALRDFARDADAKLHSWAAELPAPYPSLAILTTQPLDDMEDSSSFGWRDDPIRHTRRFHGGTDIRADPGTPVMAAGAGVVVFAGRQGGYGNCIYVDHGGGVVTLYAHLRKIETKKDEAVGAGERIGQVGMTGRTTGPHLHFEVRLDNRAVDSVTAMTVGAMERESPEAGRLAAYALAPEIQSKAIDGSDRRRGNRAHSSRPERSGRAKRQQVLW